MSDCKGPGRVVPVVDRNRCEGKEDCVEVCPFGVFEIRTLSVDDRRALSFLGRVKAFAHGNRQAFLAKANACEACGLCVTACPEKAIRLVSVDRPGNGSHLLADIPSG
jgi:NAD-dependent dihydropyrimidine dehydrogenase PreA subunit